MSDSAKPEGTPLPEICAGWYDDGNGRQRWWDGVAWTTIFQDELEGSGARVSLRALWIAVATALVLGLLVGGGVWASANSRPDAAGPSPLPAVNQPVMPSVPVATLAPVAAPAPSHANQFKIGDTIKTGAVTMTIDSVEIVQSVATTSGEPLVPDSGGQLVLFKTTYTNDVDQADLSCGNTDLYIQVFDTQKREMAPVFETYRIPGNPDCNHHLLQGVPAQWNFVFQSVAGAKLSTMSITETLSHLDPVLIELQ